jgi:hypothetical protein
LQVAAAGVSREYLVSLDPALKYEFAGMRLLVCNGDMTMDLRNVNEAQVGHGVQRVPGVSGRIHEPAGM